MDPKLRICDLKIWAAEKLIRNGKQGLFGRLHSEVHCSSKQRVGSLIRTHQENYKTLLSAKSLLYSSVQHTLIVCLCGRHWPWQWGYGAEQHRCSPSPPFPFPSSSLPSLLPSPFLPVSVHALYHYWAATGSDEKGTQEITNRVTGQDHELLPGNCNLSGQRTTHLSVRCSVLIAHHTCGTL